jgi:hypothetical protein
LIISIKSKNKIKKMIAKNSQKYYFTKKKKKKSLHMKKIEKILSNLAAEQQPLQ